METEDTKSRWIFRRIVNTVFIINDILLLPCVYVTFHYALQSFMPWRNIWTREFLGFILPVVFLRCFYIPYIISPILMILGLVGLAKSKFPPKDTVLYVILTALCVLGLISLERVFAAAMSV